ncbi:FAD-dependent oxidoreductase [Nocardioides sp. TRM66260-LWL]|uniref:FAD-dependent oxidoreductase n=1 Tax=Nocardioides sp. TRM66260-LWL TaxID=2874478 RepID=UPI0027E0329C|nr:FAD-dependent oxidoreductase [Nocardioides sp. TRM66260-LWL]
MTAASTGGWRPGRDRLAEWHPSAAASRRDDRRRHRVVVVGGGIAGLAAATSLAERGVAVTVLESTDQLGGRVASWPVQVAGETQAMSRGFHAFFRQYYNLRSLLRRTDPDLARLRSVDDYPLRLKGGPVDSFTRIPRTPPWSILGFVARSPSFRWRDLPAVDVERALALLDVEFPRTFVDHDGVSAADVLDRLGFPDQARHLALEVFARSFFADPRDFSGGELVAMFHTYFLGSAEGLLFDVPVDDFDTALWQPLAAYLRGLGVDLRTGTPALALHEHGAGVVVDSAEGPLEADAVVLATDRAPLQRLVGEAPWLGDAAWRERLGGLTVAPSFAVWRRWLDRRPSSTAAPFLGTSGYGPLDNVSFFEQLEDGAADWARRTGGSVIELHAYAVPDGTPDAVLRDRLWRETLHLHPELVDARVLHEEWLVRRDCPLAGTDPWATRPGVVTPDPRVVLAGDGIRCHLPVALMERAATTGTLAADALLAGWDVAGHGVWSAPTSPRHAVVPPLRRLVQRGR